MRFISLSVLLLAPVLLPLSASATSVVAAALPHLQADAAQPKKKDSPAKKPPSRAQTGSKPAAVKVSPVITAPGAGQTGYVHYWEITAPDGEQEIQVGIELPDQRIAWSFPGIGVSLSPFIAAGVVDAGGRPFKVQHLYGLRPFANDTAMRTLRSNLLRRVMPLVRNSVPYCELNGVSSELCMSCMGFVSQVLFPGRTPEYANFPRDFPRIAGEEYHTTEDLLLYLTGLHALPTDAARKRRMAAIGGPAVLQEELIRLTAVMVENQAPVVADAAAAVKPPPKRRTRIAPKTAIQRPAKSG